MRSGKWAGVKQQAKKRGDDHEPVPDMYNDAGKAQTINAAVRSLDAVARDAEVRWGIGKLERLADPALAVRFEQARIRLDNALRGDDVSEVVARCSDMIKGWRVLEKKVLAAGHKPQVFGVWYHRGDAGQKYAFVQDAGDAKFVDSDAITYTLDDVVRLLDTKHSFVNEVKQHWPGAEIESVKPKKREDFNDDLPF